MTRTERRQAMREYDEVFSRNLSSHPEWRRLKQGEATLTEPQMALLKEINSETGTVLDVGCGPGMLVAALHASGVEAYGCDISAKAIEFCEAHIAPLKDRFFRSALEELPKLDNQFDAVVCNEVLQEVEDPVQAIKILWDRVKDGGRLLVGLPHGEDMRTERTRHTFSQREADELARSVLKGETQRFPYKVRAVPIQTDQGKKHLFLMQIRKKEPEFLYAQVSGTTAEQQQANDIIFDTRIKTGMFNWARLFEGAAIAQKELGDPSQYDILHVQMSGTNFFVPSILRDQLGPNSKTKLIINLDYAPEYWYMYPPFPEMLLRNIQCADYIMSVEPTSARLISQLTGRKVYVIPHPTDVAAIKAVSRPFEQRHDAMVITHRDKADYVPFWMLYGSGLKTHMIGRLTPLGSADGSVVDYPALLYDKVETRYLGGVEVVNYMSQAKLAIDSYTHHVCGRSAIELAALGVPCIGNENVWAQEMCFPDTTIPAGRVDLAREIVSRLLEDEEFYRDVSAKAQQKVEFFNYANARIRFMNMLEDEHDTGLVLGTRTQTLRSAAEPGMEPTNGKVDDNAIDLPARPDSGADGDHPCDPRTPGSIPANGPADADPVTAV